MAVVSFSEAARQLGIDRSAVAVAVQILGIEPAPIPTNGKAKGLTRADLTRIRKAMGRPSPASGGQRKAAIAG